MYIQVYAIYANSMPPNRGARQLTYTRTSTLCIQIYIYVYALYTPIMLGFTRNSLVKI